MKYQPKSIISLKNYKYNIENIKKLIGHDTKLMLIIKANAYGHGAVSMAKYANKIGIFNFGVATLSEALELRQNNVLGEILILGEVPKSQMKLAYDNDLTITISRLDNLLENAPFKGQLKAHIKIDTGISRHGFYVHDLLDIQPTVEIIQLIKNNNYLNIKGMYTHFAAADEDTSYTMNQLELFNTLIKTLKENHIDYGLAHAANSAATMRYKKSHLDMVRVGLLSYGIASYDHQNFLPKPVMTLKGYIIHLKNLNQGDYIGYGNTFEVKLPMQIAVVNLGYADGIYRRLSNNGYVLVKGKKVPIVGRISMDVLMIDVTNIKLEVFDEVIIFGQSLDAYQSVSDFIFNIETIEYELLCHIGQRIERIYIED